MTQSTALDKPGVRLMLNKVPEVTLWFWVIKILCTTVGESFADWVSVGPRIGVGRRAVEARADGPDGMDVPRLGDRRRPDGCPCRQSQLRRRAASVGNAHHVAG